MKSVKKQLKKYRTGVKIKMYIKLFFFWTINRRGKMRQKSILAISETKELLKKIRKELKDEYEVITFNNFLDGLDMLRESDFDILLLDENLTWFTFAEAMRKLKGIGKDIVTIALISEENDEILNDVKDGEIYNYVVKPFTLRDINRIIIPALNNLELLKEKRDLEKIGRAHV